MWLRSGLVVSVLDFRSGGLWFEPGLRLCFVLLKTGNFCHHTANVVTSSSSSLYATTFKQLMKFNAV